MRPALLTFIPKADSKASTHPLASLQLKYVKIVIVDDQRLQETGCLVENYFRKLFTCSCTSHSVQSTKPD